jgi:DNA-binding NarL/FixJ family response regulator
MSVSTGDVLIVAPPTLYRQGLLLMLQHSWPTLNFILTADAGRAPELLRHRPCRLVVVDGLQAGRALPLLLEQLLTRAAQPVLLLTGPRLVTVLRQGLLASHQLALLPHHTPPEEVLHIIATLLCGDAGSTPKAGTGQGGRRLPPTPFSPRELDVLRLVVADCCNHEIADQLCVSVRTVESHRRALLQKTGAKTLIGLAVQAVRQGWLAA